MGILTIVEDDSASSLLPTVTNIAIVLEEAIVLADVQDFTTAFAFLFGLLYALNMDFPQDKFSTSSWNSLTLVHNVSEA